MSQRRRYTLIVSDQARDLFMIAMLKYSAELHDQNRRGESEVLRQLIDSLRNQARGE